MLFPYLEEGSSLSAQLEAVLSEISRIVDESPPLIQNDLKLLTQRPGKLLRPAFLLLCAQGGEASQGSLVSVAAAVELLHIATLAHDDVLDDAPLRRGKPTLYKKEGGKRSILAGDFLLAQSLRLASSHAQIALIDPMTKAMGKLCMSEIDQDSALGNLRISREQYFQRIRGKTAELFGLSALCGSILAGFDEKRQDAAYQMGLAFGMSFQIQDDLLDYNGNSLLMGKSLGEDLKAGIPTLPLILAQEDSDSLLKRLLSMPAVWRSFFASLISQRVKKGNAIQRSEEYVQKFHSESLSFSQTALTASVHQQFHDILEKLKQRQI